MPDEEDGSYRSRDGIRVRHHNGGPVNWGRAHYAYCLVPDDGARVRRLIDDNFDGQGCDDQPVLAGVRVVPVRAGADGASARCLVITTFAFMLDRLLGFLARYVDGVEPLVHSFAGYAKWNRVQLLEEYARGSWGVVRDGSEFVTRGWTREAACAEWDELVDEVQVEAVVP